MIELFRSIFVEFGLAKEKNNTFSLDKKLLNTFEYNGWKSDGYYLQPGTNAGYCITSRGLFWSSTHAVATSGPYTHLTLTKIINGQKWKFSKNLGPCYTIDNPSEFMNNDFLINYLQHECNVIEQKIKE